ncbi:sugar ABC transporter binding protein [Streptococcus pneumoniae]|nr:sugar ABC transporter binding protein [Streptococcus pneumoniae]
MEWYKKIGLLATTGLALFGLGACSNYGKSADDTVTIEYFNQKKEMTKTLEEITRDFEKENPKIKVKVVNVPNAGEVLKTRVLAGDVPDVVNIYPQSIELQEWAKAGVFEDLSNKDYLKRVKNGYAEKYAVNEKVYNVPFTANAYGIYYNKDKFEELGLKVPETWDEFEQLVKDIVAKGQTPFGIAGADAWTLNGYNQLAFATATGGGKEANQYLRYSQPNAIKLSDPIMKDDIKVMDILRINGSKQKNWEGAGYTDVIGAFARGDVLMTPNGSWAITAINEQKPNFKIGTFMIPGKEKGQSLTVGAGDLAWSISATTKHPKEANAFVEYMTRPEVMQKYYDVDGSPTAIEGVKQAGEDSPLAGMTEYAFTDRHLVWLQQYWTSEADFHTLTMNYVLTGDKQGMVVGEIALGIFIARVLNSKIKGQTFFRAWFFFPAVLSGLTVALIFKQVFNYGLPAIGNALHIEFLQTSLLGTKWGAIFAAVFVLLWQGVAMPIIIFLAGLQSIPTEITEAARIDGATSKQVFWNIELPYLLPSVSIVFILALKGGLTAFDQVFAMTGGGPNNATTSLGLLVYNYAFKNNQFGYANAIAVILFFLIVVISIIQLRVSKKFEI